MINLFDLMALGTFSIFPSKLNNSIDLMGEDIKHRMEMGAMVDIENLQKDRFNIFNDLSTAFNNLKSE